MNTQAGNRSASPDAKSHTWRFFRSGGLDQVRISRGADIEALSQLDPKLWVALACPVQGLDIEERTLALIDTDGDGRVRVPEILAAVDYLQRRLASLDSLVVAPGRLPLAELRTDTPEGQAAVEAAQRWLGVAQRSDATELQVDDLPPQAQRWAGLRFNGDGVITAESLDDPRLIQALERVAAVVGTVPDRSGAPGIAADQLATYRERSAAWRAWWAAGADCAAALSAWVPDGRANSLMALIEVHQAVAPAVAQFFADRRSLAYDPDQPLRSGAAAEGESVLPLARADRHTELPLGMGLNPWWTPAITRWRECVLSPAMGAIDTLSEAAFVALQAQWAPALQWWSQRPPGAPADWTMEAMEAYGGEVWSQLDAAMALDASSAPSQSGADDLEKLVRLHRDFLHLLHNFVSFEDFYAGQGRASFLVGRLFLDAREAALCLRVDDPGRHAVLASLSKCYLAYVDCTRAAGAECMGVVAVFTQGDGDYLTVGRRGLFMDRQGQDWDAIVTRIVDAPISIRQAFWAPYKKFLRLIEEQLVRRASAAQAQGDARLGTQAAAVVQADAVAKAGDKPAPAAPAGPAAGTPQPAGDARRIDLGTIALIGTAISGVAAMVGLVLEKFLGLGVYMPLGLLGALLLISGPSMVIAALKLRQRSLGPLLDANGWAINGRVKLTLPLGLTLTRMAQLPKGSQLSLTDPFAERRSPWPWILAVAGVALLGFYALRPLLP